MKQVLLQIAQGLVVIAIIALVGVIIVPTLAKLALLHSNYLAFQLTDIQALVLACILWLVALYWIIKND